MSGVEKQKEWAAHEVRQWVRLTRACNNRCLFCLDSNSHDGTARSYDEIMKEIVGGREDRKASRLILSGGEPTIHRDFIRFVNLGKRVGYRWIQTITNGRVFSYPSFARAAAAAGLNEATFSMHGHTPELHDTLVGIPGAFEQALQGLDNLRAIPGFVVNVDVVLTALNVPHLREILEFFIARGIHEFDLLHLVPHGRGWDENRERLFYDLDASMPSLERGFALRREHDLYVWTNRLPARFLEGNEDLIQDPHKIHDEVRGRWDMLTEFLSRGTPPACRDERCPFCNMESFCDTAERYRRMMETGGFDRLVVDCRETVPGLVEKSGEVLLAGSAGDPLAWIEANPGAKPVWIELDDPATAGTLLASPLIHGIVFRGPIGLLSSLLAAFPGPVEVPLDREAAAAILRDRDRYLPSSARLTLLLENRETWSDAMEKGPALDDLRALGAAGFRVANLPLCLGGLGTVLSSSLQASLVSPDGSLDLVGFTDLVIRGHLYTRSIRCKTCREFERCRGLHINHARAYGLGILEPLPR